MGVSIANLLRRYPAVGVPGIGVFRKTHQPASYDADQAAFLPPTDQIVLSEDETGVFPLTTYLAAQQQLDGVAATALVERAVRDIMDMISREGEALLDGLGYLLADGASFIFKPFEIDGFAAKAIAAKAPVGRIDEPEAPVDLGREAAVEPEEVAVTDNGASRRRYTPWIVAGVVAAVLIAAVVVWKYQLVSPGSQEVIPEPPRATMPLVEADRDSLVADSNELVATVDSVSVDSVPVDRVAVAEALPAEPSVTYEIIVGSFATMRQADKYVADMKAKGYELHAIESRMPGNRKKISWGSFATEEAAYKELARVQKTFEPGAWIAKIEHK